MHKIFAFYDILMALYIPAIVAADDPADENEPLPLPKGAFPPNEPDEENALLPLPDTPLPKLDEPDCADDPEPDKPPLPPKLVEPALLLIN